MNKKLLSLFGFEREMAARGQIRAIQRSPTGAGLAQRVSILTDGPGSRRNGPASGRSCPPRRKVGRVGETERKARSLQRVTRDRQEVGGDDRRPRVGAERGEGTPRRHLRRRLQSRGSGAVVAGTPAGRRSRSSGCRARRQARSAIACASPTARPKSRSIRWLFCADSPRWCRPSGKTRCDTSVYWPLNPPTITAGPRWRRHPSPPPAPEAPAGVQGVQADAATDPAKAGQRSLP